jgi:predicted MFS family arabinose efflux permease
MDGFGIGCIYAVNPLQLASSVLPEETGSAMSFYQLVRTVAYSLGSAMSGTLLVLSIPHGQALFADAGYTTAALVSAPYSRSRSQPACVRDTGRKTHALPRDVSQ